MAIQIKATDKLLDILRKDEFLNVYIAKMNPLATNEESFISVYPTLVTPGIKCLNSFLPDTLDVTYSIDFFVRASFHEEVVRLLQESLYRILRVLDKNISQEKEFVNVVFNSAEFDYKRANNILGSMSASFTISIQRNNKER